MSADGNWKVTINTPMGARTMNVNIATAGDTFTGKVDSEMGSQEVQGKVDGNTLTLTSEGWSNGIPAKDTTFSIEAADPKTGAPQLADTLKGTTGIAAANADLSTARMTPEVVVTLPMGTTDPSL